MDLLDDISSDMQKDYHRPQNKVLLYNLQHE